MPSVGVWFHSIAFLIMQSLYISSHTGAACCAARPRTSALGTEAVVIDFCDFISSKIVGEKKLLVLFLLKPHGRGEKKLKNAEMDSCAPGV